MIAFIAGLGELAAANVDPDTPEGQTKLMKLRNDAIDADVAAELAEYNRRP